MIPLGPGHEPLGALGYVQAACELELPINLIGVVPASENLPDGDAKSLQQQLWERHGIEVPIISWGGRRFVRVSCHIYNMTNQIDHLIDALKELLSS